jgi:hypothetical protein
MFASSAVLACDLRRDGGIHSPPVRADLSTVANRRPAARHRGVDAPAGIGHDPRR